MSEIWDASYDALSLLNYGMLKMVREKMGICDEEKAYINELLDNIEKRKKIIEEMKTLYDKFNVERNQKNYAVSNEYTEHRKKNEKIRSELTEIDNNRQKIQRKYIKCHFNTSKNYSSIKRLIEENVENMNRIKTTMSPNLVTAEMAALMETVEEEMVNEQSMIERLKLIRLSMLKEKDLLKNTVDINDLWTKYGPIIQRIATAAANNPPLALTHNPGSASIEEIDSPESKIHQISAHKNRIDECFERKDCNLSALEKTMLLIHYRDVMDDDIINKLLIRDKYGMDDDKFSA